VRRVLLGFVCAALAIVGSSIGGSVAVAATGSFASGANVSGGEEAAAARRRGRRGRRGFRGRLGPQGPAGPPGPPGPGDGGGPSGGVKISFRANFGQPPQVLFTGGGVAISAQCDAGATSGNPNLRAIATEENSSLEAAQIPGPANDGTGIQDFSQVFVNNFRGKQIRGVEHFSDFDWDAGENDSLAIAYDPEESVVGTLVNSGPGNVVVTFVYHTSIVGGQPQGDCTYDGLVWQA
jgi:hypothetical protein